MAVFPASNYSQENVLRDVHDQATQSLRTTALAVVPPGQFEVSISHVDDSIRLGDGTTLFTSTSSGGKTGLDVSLIGPIKITDGTDTLAINTDGSLNVNIVSSGASYLNVYNEATGVVAGVATVVVTYTSAISTYLQQIMYAGKYPGMFELLVNSSVLAKQYSYFTNLNGSFDFGRGLQINIGDVIQVKVTHNQLGLGNFNSNIIFMG
jgi:hypothetical protein